MKKLQLVADKPGIDWTSCIQVKNGFVNATNKHILIHLPVEEVFGFHIDEMLEINVPLISENEELYFDAFEWGKSKMDKAAFITREGNKFIAFDKKETVLGFILPVTLNGKFGNVDSIVEQVNCEPQEITEISFNYNLLAALCKAFGDEGFCTYTFYGRNRNIKVTNSESKGVGFIHPLYFS